MHANLICGSLLFSGVIYASHLIQWLVMTNNLDLCRNRWVIAKNDKLLFKGPYAIQCATYHTAWISISKDVIISICAIIHKVPLTAPINLWLSNCPHILTWLQFWDIHPESQMARKWCRLFTSVQLNATQVIPGFRIHMTQIFKCLGSQNCRIALAWAQSYSWCTV